MTSEAPVIVVSGLPRSGTSMAMQMLKAGGVPVLTDAARGADDDNPRGYLELEAVKRLRSDRAWLDRAGGHAVKIIHMLLVDLPDDRPYRIVFMNRPMTEVIRSQAIMLQRSGRTGAALSPERLAQVFQSQLAQVRQWLAARPNFQVLDVEHAEVMARPLEQARRMQAFLGLPLQVDAMVAAVDPSLHRNRGG
ncbi:MAG: sulfotransferase [Planctomycetota bacterium]